MVGIGGDEYYGRKGGCVGRAQEGEYTDTKIK